MKNKFKKVLPLLLLLMVPLSIYAAIQWEGSQNVTNIKDNLELIQTKIDDLKSDAGDKDQDQTIREIKILLEQETALREQRERELEGKEAEIANKQVEIENKIAEINKKIAENNELIKENNQLKEKADKVDGLQTEVERLKQVNANLTTNNNALNGQLEQALKDVKEIESITEGMVN